jgi:hypothetical protein
MKRVIEAAKTVIRKNFQSHIEAVNCHHNYVQKEHHFGEDVYVTRKGAVSAKAGQLGIIPGSMGARSYIVRGKGNPESFESCSHGAGRVMSRGEAKRRFTLADHRAATEGVECRKDKDVIDETPAAYKDIDAVMAAQRDLVEVVHTLKQVVCVQGVAIKDAEVGDQSVHHAHARQGQRALGQDLEVFGAVLLLGHMLHQHDDALDASHQVHRAAHALDHLAGDHPVGQVAVLADLHGTQDGQVDLAAADHGKAVVAAKDAAALDGGHRLLAGVDQVGVDFVLGGERADAQHAVLGLQPHLLVGGHKIGHQRGNAYPEVDVKTVFELTGRTGGHLVLIPRH